MQDAEKLELVKKVFRQKLDAVQDWNEFKLLVQDMSKQKFINFIKDGVQLSAEEHRNKASKANNRASSIVSILTELK